ncbi:MAG TPA: hypothetical protein ENF80_00230 [Thermofilum sp.]|nr:hypothetical protein [Thermofilum sp.]
MTDNSKILSLTTIFAALYVIVSLLPGIPVIGGKGKIEIAAFLPPLYGVFLGPLNGFVASWLGALLAWLLPPGTPKPWGLALTSASAFAALISGLSTKQRIGKIGGWVISSLIILLLLFLWYLSPVGRIAYWYPIPHWIAFFMTLTGGKWAFSLLKNSKYIPLALLLVGYPGIMTDHMVGNLLFIYLGKYLLGLGMEPSKMASLFLAVLPISILERGCMTVLLVMFGTPLIYGLIKAGLIENFTKNFMF